MDPELAKAQFRAITLAPKGGVRVRLARPPLPAAQAANAGADVGADAGAEAADQRVPAA